MLKDVYLQKQEEPGTTWLSQQSYRGEQPLLDENLNGGVLFTETFKKCSVSNFISPIFWSLNVRKHT